MEKKTEIWANTLGREDFALGNIVEINV